MSKYITIYVKLLSPKKEEVMGQIMVRDNFALSVFGDPKLAKQLYEYDSAQGESVAYNEKHNAYIKIYKGMKKEKIAKELREEIENAGGKIIDEIWD